MQRSIVSPWVVTLGALLAAPVPVPRQFLATLSIGTVFEDRNDNGTRDAGEPGIAGVAVSNQDTVVVTARDGSYTLGGAGGKGIVSVSVPDGFRSRGRFWSPLRDDSTPINFPMLRLPRQDRITFIHASDTHIAPSSLARTERLRALIDSVRPAFVIVTGDLVRDALRVGEGEAIGYFELFQQEAARVAPPLWTVPGNHEIFGIERDRSGVSASHPLYGRAMYRHYRGPDYYSFNTGGIHFVGLNSVDIDDTRYYGHVDSLQLQWLRRDLAVIPPTMPVVTFNHIPFFTAVETINGYMDAPPAPSVITVRGKAAFRHTVSNAREVLALIAMHPYPVALGGHMHVRESLRYAGVATRFEQSAAVVGPSGDAALSFPSGITVYELRRGVIGDGRFVPLGIDPR